MDTVFRPCLRGFVIRLIQAGCLFYAAGRLRHVDLPHADDVFAVVMLGFVWLLGSIAVALARTRYEVAGGDLRLSGECIPLAMIREVRSTGWFVERLVGVGSVEINTYGYGKRTMRHLAHPDKVQERLVWCVDLAKATG